MISVSDLMMDPDFTTQFSIQRKQGAFANEGVFTTTDVTIQRTGIVQPASANDVVSFVPEGERSTSMISIHCNANLLMGDGKDVEPDVILWRGGYYRIVYGKPWQDNGYWFAIARGFLP